MYLLSSISVDQSVPICRLTDKSVRWEFVTACLFAVTPINRSPPSLANATTEGVVLAPSALAITTGSPFSIVATQLFVVPKSIPITLLIFSSPNYKIGIPPSSSSSSSSLKSILTSLWGMSSFTAEP